MFKRFVVIGSLALVCVMTLTLMFGISATPASAATWAPLHIFPTPSGTFLGQLIHRCVGTQARWWSVGTDPAHPNSLEWAGYLYVIPATNCGPYDAATDTYGVVFNNATAPITRIVAGTWVTQCRPNHSGEHFTFRVDSYSANGLYSYARYLYPEVDATCP